MSLLFVAFPALLAFVLSAAITFLWASRDRTEPRARAPRASHSGAASHVATAPPEGAAPSSPG